MNHHPEEQQVFQAIYPYLQRMYKYYHLKRSHKINMQVFQEQMNISCQEIMRLCTFYEEISNHGSQWELVWKDFKKNQEQYSTKKYRSSL